MTATSSETKDEPGKRYDVGKPRYDLIPPEALEELAKLYEMGARKYSDRNWEKGMSWSRCFGPLMRHAWAYWRGENNDPESGLPHMVHVAWNALALVHFGKFERYHEFDDRAERPAPLPPLVPPKPKPKHKFICEAHRTRRTGFYIRQCDKALVKSPLIGGKTQICNNCGHVRKYLP